MTDEANQPKLALRLDYLGKNCSDMNLDLRLKIKEIQVGEILEVISDSEEAPLKMPKWCLKNKQELFFTNTKDGVYYFYIKRIQ
ncbi:MAG: sulfurtransferase TusA family protein [Asgard group archaeon]|nr:sulfurtransferase TusA family protein [Asgard group archaeon]